MAANGVSMATGTKLSFGLPQRRRRRFYGFLFPGCHYASIYYEQQRKFHFSPGRQRTLFSLFIQRHQSIFTFVYLFLFLDLGRFLRGFFIRCEYGDSKAAIYISGFDNTNCCKASADVSSATFALLNKISAETFCHFIVLSDDNTLKK